MKYDTSDIPWYHRWLLKYPKSRWPTWMQKRVLDGRIEVCIYHQDRESAAEVVKKWTEYTLERSFGHRFRIDVWIRRKSIPTDMDEGEAFGHVRDELAYANDCNIVLLPHCDNTGGGSGAKANVDTPFDETPDVGDILGEEPRLTTSGEPYSTLHSVVHEIGHCLGLYNHDDGGVYEIDGQTYASLMTYNDDMERQLWEFRDWNDPIQYTEW